MSNLQRSLLSCTFKIKIQTLPMNRRHLLKEMGVIALYSTFPAVLSEFVSSCNQKTKELRAGFFSEDEFHLLEEITNILLPATTTPGALAAQTPYFVDLVVKDCMNHDDQELIRKGLRQMNRGTNENFSSLSLQGKSDAIKKIDEAAFHNDVNQAWFRI